MYLFCFGFVFCLVFTFLTSKITVVLKFQMFFNVTITTFPTKLVTEKCFTITRAVS